MNWYKKALRFNKDIDFNNLNELLTKREQSLQANNSLNEMVDKTIKNNQQLKDEGFTTETLDNILDGIYGGNTKRKTDEILDKWAEPIINNIIYSIKLVGKIDDDKKFAKDLSIKLADIIKQNENIKDQAINNEIVNQLFHLVLNMLSDSNE